MSQYYVIKGVKRGNEWSNSFGNFQSYSLSLEGMGEPVSLNKAIPVKEEPETGQKLYGTVEMLQNQKGTTYYKFKSEKVPEGEYVAPTPKQGSEGSYEGHSDKEDSIARAVALKATVELNARNKVAVAPEQIVQEAEFYLAWLKNESSATQAPPASGYDKAKQARQQLNEEPLPEEPGDLLGWINEGAEHDDD